MPNDLARELERRAQEGPDVLERFVQREFDKLDDGAKVQVMREVIRHALLHIRTARAPGSDYVTFLSFLAGHTFEEVVLWPLEAISGWEPGHTDYAHRRAERIQESVDQEMLPGQIKSPMLRFKTLKRLLVGGGILAAGVGASLLGRTIWRARQKQCAETSAREP
jgi:hypothetical protein